ncbi:MAG: S-layer protein [Verrucomicrobiales bacterium]|nr:S-layer protein [Verrucomicrobiales bacterium]
MKTTKHIFSILFPVLLGFTTSDAQEKEKAPALPKAQLETQVSAFSLKGPYGGQQIVVTNKSNGETDVTGSAQFQAKPEGIVAIDSHGYITPLKNGTATISATLPGHTGPAATTKATVTDFDSEPAIDFPNEVVPVFTKYGCNGGGCHGKSGGQNNFRLSLLGYEPWNDHDWLVKESKGRRISPAAPQNSLLLMKATGEIPHEGGIRLDRESTDYQTLVRWIKQGMPYPNDGNPKVERIEVFPKERVLSAEAQQQLAVTAFYSDGTAQDITRTAIYEANQEDRAEVDTNGLVTLNDKTGTTSVMIRFQEHVDVFRATIPLGKEIDSLPSPNNLIDEHIFSKLTLLGLPPSRGTGDAEFLRRVTVDIAGRLPSVEETREFLSSKNPDKRTRKIDELLDSPDYAAYFAQKWAGIFRNKRAKDTYQRGTFAFHDWLRTNLANNRPYDELVSELVTASGEIGQNPAVGWYRAVKDQKEQMQDIAQVFLGIRMQCAQCHHHPYEKWSQDDYYGFAAFLTTVGRKQGEQPDEEIVYHRRTTAAMQNPNTKVTLKPTPLGEEPLDIPAAQDPRKQLADWLTSSDNPWFARMLVNRYWKHFFSIGLVEPEDDMRVTNPASHPDLLNELAIHFASTDFDLKELIRTICNSRTYQLSAVPNEHNAKDSQNFSRYYPKRLQAEVLLDAINTVSDAEDTFNGQPAGVRATWLPDDKFNDDSFFLTVFGRPEMDSACECERVADANLAQSLHLINSDTIQKKLADEDGRAAALATATDRPDTDRLSDLYLHALAREPNAKELEAAKAHLKKKRSKAAEKPDDEITPDLAEKEAFEDILWAIVNTKEFLFNH